MTTNARPICLQCNKHPCAVNYIKNSKRHYRKICDHCGKQKAKKKPSLFNWEKAGYKKKSQCDLCGFKSLYPSQITVFHVDGDLNNVDYINLKSICLNCVEIVKRKEVTWKRGDLVVDY